MINSSEFIEHAHALIFKPQGITVFITHRDFITPSQIEMRRAVSSAYYALFHELTTTGSRLLTAGGAALHYQVARAYSHSAMRKVCDAYVRSPARPFPVLDHLSPSAPDQRIIRVASAFAELQDGRHAADYDVSLTFEFNYAASLVTIAETALADFEAVKSLPETTVFLTALLLADRWTRRG